jgi:FtsZ-interacting cell division protein ZipA
MSELQISLLAIGVLVVLAVYLYGAWQHRRYRSRFGAAFKSSREDVLYEGALTADAKAAPRRPDTAPDASREPLQQGLFTSDVEDAAVEQEDPCTTLAAETDFVAALFGPAPLPANVLAPIAARRFDFDKPVYICGVRASGGTWEKVAADGKHTYHTFRIGLQLADRNGPISQERIEDFRDMLRDVTGLLKQAELNVPSVEEAAAHAQQLDAFCAAVDQMVGINILPAGDSLLMGDDVARVAARHGMVLRADGEFHLLDAGGHTLFTLRNFDESPFLEHELEGLPVIGLSLEMDVPRVENPARRFEEMVALARALGEDLRADVVDDHRMALGDAGIAMIRKQVAAIDKKMQASSIPPGSALARRLFS